MDVLPAEKTAGKPGSRLSADRLKGRRRPGREGEGGCRSHPGSAWRRADWPPVFLWGKRFPGYPADRPAGFRQTAKGPWAALLPARRGCSTPGKAARRGNPPQGKAFAANGNALLPLVRLGLGRAAAAVRMLLPRQEAADRPGRSIYFFGFFEIKKKGSFCFFLSLLALVFLVDTFLYHAPNPYLIKKIPLCPL